MGTLGDGIGAQTDRLIKLCDVLGINAEETANVHIEVNPGAHAVVTWTGRRRLTAEQLGRLIDVFDETAEPGPALPTADPWGKAPEPPC